MDLVALSSGFQWSQHRTHLGIAKKVNGLSLLVPNPEYQAPPMMKKDEKKEIAKDQSVSTNSTQSHNTNTMNAQSTDVRLQKFNVLLNAQTIDLDSLRSLAWGGIPSHLRAKTWKFLSGYLPANKDRRESALERKRTEYKNSLPHFNKVKESLNLPDRDEYESTTYRQIHIDIPRTGPTSPLLQQQTVQDSLERILFTWALRHPASGYVQGINDLVTPFFVVFLSEYINSTIDTCNVEKEVSNENLLMVEADCFWCMSNLLNYIQDNYTFAQIGIQRMIFRFEELVTHIDSKLAKHLEEQGATFIQFAFRWMNCLLMREIPLHLIVRVWDTYLSEAEDFAVFHVYVCAAFLIHWSDQLKKLEFQELMLFLQRLPTSKWTEDDIKMLLSQAFLYKSLYHESLSHLRN